jgi:predicted aldo/keto reductase-like oxidoreductase
MEKVQKLTVIPFLEKKAERGKIRHLGFFFMTAFSLFKEVVDFRLWISVR